MESLSGKTALVTGASRGIGRAIAQGLAAEGAQVWGSSRSAPNSDWPQGVTHAAMDLSAPQSAAAAWESSGLATAGIDILVNNAGAGVFGDFCSSPFEPWREQIEVMLLAPMQLTRLAGAGWTADRPGVLVNVTSLSVEWPIPYMSGYNAAKAGLAAFSESMAMELGMRGRVIELRLGDFRSDFNKRAAVIEGCAGGRAVWERTSRRQQSSPEPELAARRLIKALRRGENGTIRAGSFFQTVVASLAARFGSQKAKRAGNLRYYNLED